MQLEDTIREKEKQITSFQKEQSEMRGEIKKEKQVEKTIQEDIKVAKYKQTRVEKSIEESKSEKNKTQQSIQNLEKQYNEIMKWLEDAYKKIKKLTAVRESMARKASSAMKEVREQREEMKIKELLILDLEKKCQLTEQELNSCKVRYEEVKSARNKYVNMIQNSSQDLAELKERIKIFQNELDILKNERQEKDATLKQYKHIIQKENQKKDRDRNLKNKADLDKKQKSESVNQNIKEIEQLNIITSSLEKEMIQLRQQFEHAQDDRNHIGIQLIDINDDLCVLYDSTNTQQQILKNGEQEIKIVEDNIRMIKIEIKEYQRKIDVSRKQIDKVPELSDKVIQLKLQLETEQQREQKLSEDLENPSNLNRWRELKGYDPDEESLKQKIFNLEERLNNKKEQLLEKELILDEITSLSEKLRKQALDGRQNTLELSEKLNDFQARLKDITRKMMASISELSMFQATAIKLEIEQKELKTIYDEAKQRMDQGQAPTLETEIEYLKMLRDKKRYEEERAARRQEQQILKNLPAFATKTTAENRVNAYVPDDKLNIPKPYGKHAPFKPNQLQMNMVRFCKKPVQKDVVV